MSHKTTVVSRLLHLNIETQSRVTTSTLDCDNVLNGTYKISDKQVYKIPSSFFTRIRTGTRHDFRDGVWFSCETDEQYIWTRKPFTFCTTDQKFLLFMLKTYSYGSKSHPFGSNSWINFTGSETNQRMIWQCSWHVLLTSE